MKTLKWLLGTVAVLVIVIIMAAVVLPMVIKPNHFREHISAAVYDATGMQLAINGDIGWSVFPWLGLSIHDVVVNDGQNRPFGALQHASVGVKVIPLLHRRVEVATVELDGVTLNLLVDKQGRANWDSGQKPVSSRSTSLATTATPTATPESEPAGALFSLESLNISGINIKNMTINYRDIAADRSVTVGKMELTTGPITFGQPFQINTALDIESNSAALKTRLSLSATVTAEPREASYKIDNLDYTMTPVGVANPQALRVIGDMVIRDKALSGRMQLQPVDLATAMEQLNISLPRLAGGDKVLRRVSLAANIQADSNTLSLTDMLFVVDNNELQGQLAVTDLTTREVRFNMTGNDIIVDPYLPVAGSPIAATTSSSRSSSKQKTMAHQFHADSHGLTPTHSTTPTPPPSAEVVLIPVHTIQALKIRGSAQLESLSVKGVLLTKPSIEVQAADGHAQVTRLNAGFYQGTISAAAGIDVRSELAARPQISARVDVSAVSLGAVATQIEQLNGVSGRASARLKVLSHGLTDQQLINNLNGTGGFHVTNGALSGINLNRHVCGLIARVRNKESTRTDWPDQTRFTQLDGSVTIVDGVAHNKNLTAALDLLNLQGHGDINLVNQTMDYHIGLTITGDRADQQDTACRINERYANITWPLHCQGPLGKGGQCGIDEQRFAEVLAQVAEQSLKSTIQKRLEDKLKDKFSDFLRGL